MLRSQTLTVSIARPPAVVVDFIRDYRRLREWLSFISGVREQDGRWMMETPTGAMQIEFVPANELGVVDHRVTLADGQTFLNPMRVVANGAGSEAMFTLYQAPGMSDEQFADDAKTVQTDLNSLARLLGRQNKES
jgi:hypothetical protein